MINKIEEQLKKKRNSSSRSSSVEKQSPTVGATNETVSPSTAHSKKLGAAPKSNESCLKQALIIHYANVQQISIDWFKFLTEQIDAIKRAGSPQGTGSPTRNILEQNNCNDDEKNVLSSNVQLETTIHGKSSHQIRLIHPTEVQISEHTIHEVPKFLSSPTEGTVECLQMQNALFVSGLKQKEVIVSELFKTPREKMEKLSESIFDRKSEAPDAKTLLLASILQADRLLESINENLKVVQAVPKSPTKSPQHLQRKENLIQSISPTRNPPAVSCTQLALIVPPLLKHLSSLLQTIKSLENEISETRGEMLRCKIEFGSCSSLFRDSPAESMHEALTTKLSAGDDAKKNEMSKSVG